MGVNYYQTICYDFFTNVQLSLDFKILGTLRCQALLKGKKIMKSSDKHMGLQLHCSPALVNCSKHLYMEYKSEFVSYIYDFFSHICMSYHQIDSTLTLFQEGKAICPNVIREKKKFVLHPRNTKSLKKSDKNVHNNSLNARKSPCLDYLFMTS